MPNALSPGGRGTDVITSPATPILISPTGAVMKYPEFNAHDDNMAQVLGALQNLGSVLIRQAFEPAALAPFLERAQQAYAQADQAWEQQQMDTSYYKLYYQYGHVEPHACGRGPGDFQTVGDLVFHSRLLPTLRQMFGPALAMFYQNTLFRRQGNATQNAPVPFHQDSQFLGFTANCVNIWTPLVPCGEEAPGLEVILKPMRQMLTAPEGQITDGSGYTAIDLGTERIQQLFPATAFWHPVMEVGDVLLFTHMTIHRTYQLPTMTKPRFSLEIRCTRPTTADIYRAAFVLLDLQQGTTTLRPMPGI